MFLTSKNGKLSTVLYSVEQVIQWHKKGFTVYNPLYNSYGNLWIPTQSVCMRMFLNNQLEVMIFDHNDLPVINTPLIL